MRRPLCRTARQVRSGQVLACPTHPPTSPGWSRSRSRAASSKGAPPPAGEPEPSPTISSATTATGTHSAYPMPRSTLRPDRQKKLQPRSRRLPRLMRGAAQDNDSSEAHTDLAVCVLPATAAPPPPPPLLLLLRLLSPRPVREVGLGLAAVARSAKGTHGHTATKTKTKTRQRSSVFFLSYLPSAAERSSGAAQRLQPWAGSLT